MESISSTLKEPVGGGVASEYLSVLTTANARRVAKKNISKRRYRLNRKARRGLARFHMMVLTELQQYFSRAIDPKRQTKHLEHIKTSKEAAEGEVMAFGDTRSRIVENEEEMAAVLQEVEAMARADIKSTRSRTRTRR